MAAELQLQGTWDKTDDQIKGILGLRLSPNLCTHLGTNGAPATAAQSWTSVKLWIHVILSGRKRCGVEIRMGRKKVRMFPVTDKGLASTYVLCHPSPMCP